MWERGALYVLVNSVLVGRKLVGAWEHQICFVD